jgi:hypothetical protein
MFEGSYLDGEQEAMQHSGSESRIGGEDESGEVFNIVKVRKKERPTSIVVPAFTADPHCLSHRLLF